MPAVRSLFLSDIHLGTRACQADRLNDFLRAYKAESVFLIGDIVDFWAMNRGIHWTAEQNTFVQKLLRRARRGERVVFVPGNHDEALREYVGIAFGDIEVVAEHVHELADGRRFLLLHGDEFDQITRHHRWVAVLGDVAYDWLVRLNGILSYARRRLGISGYWSLAGYAKRRIKKALQFVFDFEDSALELIAWGSAAESGGQSVAAPANNQSQQIEPIGGVDFDRSGLAHEGCPRKAHSRASPLLHPFVSA